MSTDQQIEQEIQDKGLTAPRVTPADVEAEIAGETYFTAATKYRESGTRGRNTAEHARVSGLGKIARPCPGGAKARGRGL